MQCDPDICLHHGDRTDELASLPYLQSLSAARQAAQGVFPSHRILRPRQRSQACDVLSRFRGGSLRCCSFCMASSRTKLDSVSSEADRHVSIRSGPTGMHSIPLHNFKSNEPPGGHGMTAGKVERQVYGATLLRCHISGPSAKGAKLLFGSYTHTNPNPFVYIDPIRSLIKLL